MGDHRSRRLTRRGARRPLAPPIGNAAPLRAAQPIRLELDCDGAVRVHGHVGHGVFGDPRAVGAPHVDVAGERRGEGVAVKVLVLEFSPSQKVAWPV